MSSLTGNTVILQRCEGLLTQNYKISCIPLNPFIKGFLLNIYNKKKHSCVYEFVCVYDFFLIIGKKCVQKELLNFPGVITYSVFSRCLKKLSCLKLPSDWSPCSPSVVTDLLLIIVNLSMRSISTNNLSEEEGFLCHPS